jgi:hypothetical protein
MVSRPYRHVKQNIIDGSASPSFVLDCLQKFEDELANEDMKKEQIDHLVIWAAGAMYGGQSIMSFLGYAAVYSSNNLLAAGGESVRISMVSCLLLANSLERFSV